MTLVVVLLVVSAASGVIYWIQRGTQNAVDLQVGRDTQADLKDHLSAVTAADRAVTRASVRSFDAKAAAVGSATGAARLLRDSVSLDDPSVN